MAHAPVASLVVVDLHVERAVENSALANYVNEQFAALPSECGASPFSYLTRVSVFLHPGSNNHPDWGLVAPHLPPSDVLEPCMRALLREQSGSFTPFGWITLLRQGLRWGGQLQSDHDVVAPLLGGLVVGESKTVRAVLDVARGNQPAFEEGMDDLLTEEERTQLSQSVPNAVARAVLVPPKSEALRAYWMKRLPGLWPSLEKIKAATAGLSLGQTLRLRAVVITKPEFLQSLRQSLGESLSRLTVLLSLVPGAPLIPDDVLVVKESALMMDVSVPFSVFDLLSPR